MRDVNAKQQVEKEKKQEYTFLDFYPLTIFLAGFGTEELMSVSHAGPAIPQVAFCLVSDSPRKGQQSYHRREHAERRARRQGRLLGKDTTHSRICAETIALIVD